MSDPNESILKTLGFKTNIVTESEVEQVKQVEEESGDNKYAEETIRAIPNPAREAILADTLLKSCNNIVEKYKVIQLMQELGKIDEHVSRTIIENI